MQVSGSHPDIEIVGPYQVKLQLGNCIMNYVTNGALSHGEKSAKHSLICIHRVHLAMHLN